MSVWPRGWAGIDDPTHRQTFAAELASELGKGHVLKGSKATPIARADGSDDYLFQLEDGRVAEVHLTFCNRPESPPWPMTAVFESLAAWRKAIEDER